MKAMSDRRKALGTLGLSVLASFALSWVLTPWADLVALILVIAMAPLATLFAGVYMFTRPWWERVIGRALLVSTTGFALLVDISLLYQWLGDSYYFRDAVRLTVFQLLLVGVFYKNDALFGWSDWLRRRRRGDDVL